MDKSETYNEAMRQSVMYPEEIVYVFSISSKIHYSFDMPFFTKDILAVFKNGKRIDEEELGV